MCIFYLYIYIHTLYLLEQRYCTHFLSHALLNTGELEEHRGKELGNNVLKLVICFSMAQAKEHTFQLIC